MVLFLKTLDSEDIDKEPQPGYSNSNIYSAYLLEFM